MCLFTICISSLVKCPLRVLPIFFFFLFTQVVCFLTIDFEFFVYFT